MTLLGQHLLTALALIFVIEGLIYAIFPDLIRKLMATAIAQPIARLRLFGLCMAVTGVCLTGVLQQLY